MMHTFTKKKDLRDLAESEFYFRFNPTNYLDQRHLCRKEVVFPFPNQGPSVRSRPSDPWGPWLKSRVIYPWFLRRMDFLLNNKVDVSNIIRITVTSLKKKCMIFLEKIVLITGDCSFIPVDIYLESPCIARYIRENVCRGSCLTPWGVHFLSFILQARQIFLINIMHVQNSYQFILARIKCGWVRIYIVPTLDSDTYVSSQISNVYLECTLLPPQTSS